MRSEKIGFYFKSPEAGFDAFDWDSAVDPGLEAELAQIEARETNDLVSNVVAERLGVDQAIVDDHVRGGLRDLGLSEAVTSTPVVVRQADDTARRGVVLTPAPTPVAPTPDAPRPAEPAARVIDRTEAHVLPENPNWDEYDDYARRNFARLEGLMKAPVSGRGEQNQKDKGASKLVVAKAVLNHLGYDPDLVESMAQNNGGREVIVMAKQWAFARRAGLDDVFTTDVAEGAEVVEKIRRLTYATGDLSQQQRNNYTNEILHATGIDKSQLERVLNYGILIEDVNKPGLQKKLFDTIVAEGGLAVGKVSEVVTRIEATGQRATVALLLDAERRGEGGVKVSKLISFVREAGVLVDPNISWADLIDKKNIILLQLMVDQKSATQVTAMTPDQREAKTGALLRLAWGAFLKVENGATKPLDPTKEELDKLATDYMMDFAPTSRRGKIFVLEYINAYRAHLKDRYGLTFNNEATGKKEAFVLKDRAALDGYLLMEYEQLYLGRESGRTYSLPSSDRLPMNTDQLIDLAETQRIISYREKQEILDRREAVRALVRLQGEMNIQSNVTEGMLTTAGDLEKNRRMEKLLNMDVRKKNGNTVTEVLRARGGGNITIAHIIAEMDRRAKDTVITTGDFYDIWDENNMALLSRDFGGNEMAVRIARDLYFVTGGAAKYEISRGTVDPSDPNKLNFKKQKRGAIDFRDLVNPIEIKFSREGFGDNFERDRRFLLYGNREFNGVNPRVMSFWDSDGPESKDRMVRIAQFRKDNPGKPFFDYPPLTVDLINQRVALMYASQEPKQMFAWMKRMKSAEALIKAEEEFLQADDKDDRWNKFKALPAAYGYMGSEARAAFGERVVAHYEYLARRNQTPHSGLDITRDSIKNLFLTFVKKNMNMADYNNLSARFNRDKRFYTDKRSSQASSELDGQMSEIKRASIGEFLLKIGKDILSSGLS